MSFMFSAIDQYAREKEREELKKLKEAVRVLLSLRGPTLVTHLRWACV